MPLPLPAMAWSSAFKLVKRTEWKALCVLVPLPVCWCVFVIFGNTDCAVKNNCAVIDRVRERSVVTSTVRVVKRLESSVWWEQSSSSCSFLAADLSYVLARRNLWILPGAFFITDTTLGGIVLYLVLNVLTLH